LPPDQPTESPLLFFVAQRQVPNKTPTAVLAIDRRTGRNVYENDLAGPGTITSEIVADRQKATVSLSLLSNSNRLLTFQFTDKPVPPQPPAQTGEMASSTAGKAAGTADNSLGAAIELLRGGLNPRNLIPPSRPRPPAPPGR
jgi:hypothetical protein